MLTESEITTLQEENARLKRILKSHYPQDSLKLKDDFEYIHSNLVHWLKLFSEYIYNVSVSKGWWGTDTNDGAICARIHGEVSEIMEALRYDNPESDHIEMSLAEEEIADVILMCLEFAKFKNWDVFNALSLKTKFNENRPFKHGKKF